MNQKSSTSSPEHSQLQQKDEMQMKDELSDLTSWRKGQPSQHDSSRGSILDESGLIPTGIQLPEPEITHPSREEAQPPTKVAAEPLTSEGRELITRTSSLKSERDENDSSTSSVSGRGEEFPPPALIEARLVEEGQKPEIVDAMNVEIEAEEKPLKRLIGWGCCLLVVVVVSVALAVSLGPKSQKSAPDTGTTGSTLAPSASPTFDRGISWKQLGNVIYGEDENDVSGMQVKLSHDGSVAAISADKNDGAHGAKSGHVRVYKWYNESQDWLQLGKDIDGPGPYGYIARTPGSLALSGDGNVVAFASTRTEVASRGTYVYAWDSNGNIWKQRGSSNVEGEEPPILSGYALDLSENGNILALSSKLHSSWNSPRKVTIFQWNEEQAIWEQRGEPLLDDFAFGMSISMNADGSVLAVSIPSHTQQELEGMTRVYAWDGFAWSQLGQDLPGYTGETSLETEDLSAGGSTLAIKLSDHIIILTWDESTGRWVSKGDIIPGECDYISLSGDGDRLAAVSWNNYKRSSEAFLYEWLGNNWTRQGLMLLGNQKIDGYAIYLSLSGDGKVVAIGNLAADHQVDTTLLLKDTGAVSLYAWP